MSERFDYSFILKSVATFVSADAKGGKQNGMKIQR